MSSPFVALRALAVRSRSRPVRETAAAGRAVPARASSSGERQRAPRKAGADSEAARHACGHVGPLRRTMDVQRRAIKTPGGARRRAAIRENSGRRFFFLGPTRLKTLCLGSPASDFPGWSRATACDVEAFGGARRLTCARRAGPRARAARLSHERRRRVARCARVEVGLTWRRGCSRHD